MKARRSWINVLWTPTDHGCEPRLLYPAKLSINIEELKKIFHDKTRFNQYFATHKVLEGKLQPKNLAISTKTQTTDDIRATNPRGKKAQRLTSPTTKTKLTGNSNHWLLLSLNINGLKSPIERHGLTNWIQKQNPFFCCI